MMKTKFPGICSAVACAVFWMALCHITCCLKAHAETDVALCKTPADVFEGMGKSFKPSQARDVHARYQFSISGPEGGNWWVTVNDGKCEIGRGIIEAPDVTLTVGAADWVAIANGKLSGTWAFLTGRLRIHGSFGTARKLDPMFSQRAPDVIFFVEDSARVLHRRVCS
jgi:putative sterol carrier protein